MTATYGESSSTRDRHASKLLYGTAPLDRAPSPPENVTTLAQLFQHQARIRPDGVAFSCLNGDRLQKMTYFEADLIAKTIGLQIARQRSEDDKAPVIAVWLEKGLALVLAILATTYSGATWLPFDPDVPVDRATTCVTDAAATIIVCDQAHEARANEVRRRVTQTQTSGINSSLEVKIFDKLSKPSTSLGRLNSSLPVARPEDACYLIYTSGTTGTPKGIAISQAAALTFVFSERAVLQTSPRDVVWNGFSPAFDMFVEEMWITICGGGHLAIGTREECQDVPGLPALWATRGVTIVNAVPTLIGIMGVVQGDEVSSLLPPSIRLINLGGEACPPALVTRLARPGLRILNTYGPTETT
jgi:non-ribosomal peptide synthetase component F